MPLPGSLIRVTFLMTLHGQRLNNVVHFICTNLNLEYDGLVAELNTNWIANWKTIQSNQLVWIGYEFKVLDPANMPTVPKTITQVPGSVNLTAHHVTSSLCVKWHTPFASRRHRGRMYVAGMPGTYIGNSVWTSTLNTGVSNVLTTILARYTNQSNPLYLVVLSRVGGNVTAVTGASWNPNVCHQLRRNISIGV